MQRRWPIAAVLVPIAMMVSSGPRVPSCRADTPDCVPPHHSTGDPAEGTWTGYFRLSYRMKLRSPAVPPIPVKTEGDLAYELTHRGQMLFPHKLRAPGEQSSIEPEAPALRRPLGAPPPPAPPKPGNPTPEWVDTDPQIRGTAKINNMTAALAYQRRGDRITEDVATQNRPALELKEELSLYKDKIVALVGFGDPARVQLGMNIGGRTADGHTVSGKMSSDGAGTIQSGRLSERSPRGGSNNTDISNREGRTSVHGEGRTDEGKPFQYDQSAATLSAASGGTRQLLRLEVKEQDCWLMKGSVDTQDMERKLQVAGIGIEIVESEWMATLDERDMGFEQAVKRFASAPIPAKLTWEYVNGVMSEFSRLRGSNPTDYHLCVLAAAHEKVVRVEIAELKALIESYPKVSEGATVVVLRAANERIVPILRQLQLRDIQCELTTTAEKVMREEAEAAKRLSPRR